MVPFLFDWCFGNESAKQRSSKRRKRKKHRPLRVEDLEVRQVLSGSSLLASAVDLDNYTFASVATQQQVEVANVPSAGEVGAGAEQAQALRTVTVSNSAQLRSAINSATAGTHIIVNPGVYTGGIHKGGLKGTADNPIVIRAADPNNLPILRGGDEGLKLSDATYLEINGLIIEGARINGLSIDDGGTYSTPAHHITLRNLVIRNIGSNGNQDGIKFAGVDDFLIDNVQIQYWGRGGGSAIDMVGAHRGVIQNSTFRHGDFVAGVAVQAKGGSTDILVTHSRFENAGVRAMQIGGYTDLQFFRPEVTNYEAKNIVVEHNVFIGSQAPIAFVNADTSYVRYNTFYRPQDWVIRILQEVNKPGFTPSRNGVFTDNIIAYKSSEGVEAVNVGRNTAPETFQFARNVWYNIDNPTKSKLWLPTAEVDGVYGVNPQFVNAAGGDFHLQPSSPVSQHGAYATPPQPTLPIITVSNNSELQTALDNAKPGTEILLRAGVYTGNINKANLQGTADRPIIIRAADPSNKPIIRGGTEGIRLTDAAYVEIRDLIVERSVTNGIHIDDGGTYDTPSHHITISGVVVRHTGNWGTQNGIRLSGVNDFRIENTTVQDWGYSGTGIELTGTHRGVIENNTLSDSSTQGNSGIKIAGGSSTIAVRGNQLTNASRVAIQVGGNTPRQNFRTNESTIQFEARNVMIERNVIIGSQTAIVFNGSDTTIVSNNTIHLPSNWIFQVVKENNTSGMLSTRNTMITGNLITFRSSDRVEALSAGANTSPSTFFFTQNWWYSIDNPSQSKLSLPTAELLSVYGVDPLFANPSSGDLQLKSGSPAARYGAFATR